MSYTYNADKGCWIHYVESEDGVCSDHGVICAVIGVARRTYARDVAWHFKEVAADFCFQETSYSTITIGDDVAVIAGAIWREEHKHVRGYALRFWNACKEKMKDYPSGSVELLRPDEFQHRKVLAKLCASAFNLGEDSDE